MMSGNGRRSIRWQWWLLALVSLVGCQKVDTLAETCQKHSAMCADLSLNYTCGDQRDQLLALRQQLGLDDDSFAMLQALESYNLCLRREAAIQHVNNAYLTQDAKRAYAMTSENLAHLQQRTRGSTDPQLAYYHWVKLAENEALVQLRLLQQQGKVQQSYILAGLASSWLKSDPEKARELYLQALNNASASDFNADWLLALAQVTPQVELKYLLQKANLLLTERNANMQMLTASLGNQRAKLQQLDADAEQLAKLLRKGDYAGSTWPKALAVADTAANSEAAATASGQSSGAVTERVKADNSDSSVKFKFR